MFIVDAPEGAARRGPMRLLYLALGWIFALLAVISAFIPGIPEAVFLMLAVWAFSRSSWRLYHWLYHHPRLGRTIRTWYLHRAIPPMVKGLAVAGMAAGVISAALFLDRGWGLPVAMAVALIPIAAFILTRPGGPGTPNPSPG